MDLLFLGTSSATPTKSRNVSGLALLEESGRGWCLIDCGEGTQHQVLHSPLSLADLQAIFITHVHGDHCYGLPGLLASAGLQAREKPLPIIAPAGIEDWIRSTRQLPQLFLPFELVFLHTESLADWRLANWRVDAYPLSHRVPSFAYRFTEARSEPRLDTEKLITDGVPRGPAWGQLMKGIDVEVEGTMRKSSDYLRFPNAPRRIVIAGDNDRPDLLAAPCREAQVLIHEATYTTEIAGRMAGHGHSSAAAVAGFAQSIALPNLILTHFSARYQAGTGRSPSIEDIRMEAALHYHGQLFLAEDFARYRLNKAGQLLRVA
ncbi:MAG TPA: MBL fold metallo-hydrolase [Noviherbaspirillum sp.]